MRHSQFCFSDEKKKIIKHECTRQYSTTRAYSLDQELGAQPGDASAGADAG